MIKKEFVKSAVIAASQFDPCAAAFSALLQSVSDSKYRSELEKWKDDVESRVSQIENFFNPSISITENALNVGQILSQACEKGLCGEILYVEDVEIANVNLNHVDICEACYELEYLGFVKNLKDSGGICGISPLYSLFWFFDELALGTCVCKDCYSLARWMLGSIDSSGRGKEPTKDFILQSMWRKRRFNPAYALLLCSIDELSVDGELGSNLGKETQLDFVASHIFYSPDLIVKLRRLIRER